MKTALLKLFVAGVFIFCGTNAKAFTAVMSGSWSNSSTWGGVGPGAVVANSDIIIPSGIIVDMNMNVSFSGAMNSFTVNGGLNSSTNSSAQISSGTFDGNGVVNIHRLAFSGSSSNSFIGVATLADFQDKGAALVLTGNFIISDTLDLDGGSVTLGSGSTLTVAAFGNVRVNNGTFSASGGTFIGASPYDVWYVGSSKTSGLELAMPTLRDVHLSLSGNTQILSQGTTPVIVSRNLIMNAGEYNLNGKSLAIGSDLMITAGSKFLSNANSNLTILGSGNLSSSLTFVAGSALNNLIIQRTSSGTVQLANTISISGTLSLLDATFDLLGLSVLTMDTNSTILIANGNLISNGGTFNGSAIYNVVYVGGNHNSDIELSGAGLNNVTITLTSSTAKVTLGTNATVNGNFSLLNGELSLAGKSLFLDGTFDQLPTAFFIGSASSKLVLNLDSSSNDSLYFEPGFSNLLQLLINIPSTSNIALGSDLFIANQLIFVSGKLELFNHNLHFFTMASITGYSDTRYVMTSGTGKLWMNVISNGSYVYYPIGTATNFAPAQIQQSASGSTGMFGANVKDGVFTGGLTGYNSAIVSSVVNKTWDISAFSGVVVNMNIKLGWKVSDEVNGFNRSSAYISHYTNSWDVKIPSAAVAGSYNTFELSRPGLTSDGVFAVVDVNAILSNETISSSPVISIYPNPTTDFVMVENPAATENYLYEWFDLTGKLIYSMVNNSSRVKFDLGGFENGIYIFRITNTSDHTVVVRRIVKS